jgi:hypothetical protein
VYWLVNIRGVIDAKDSNLASLRLTDELLLIPVYCKLALECWVPHVERTRMLPLCIFCGIRSVSKRFGEWYQKTNKTEDTN